MVDFNDYDYSSLNPNSKIGKLAARADKDTSGKIDSSEEKSIFLNGAKNLVKQGKLENSVFKEIFGTDYKEDLKYDGEEGSTGGSGGGSGETATTDAYSAGNGVYNLLKGYTEDYEYSAINESIDSKHLNKNNIVDFLSGFYAGDSHEGIIEYLDDEHDGGAIKMVNKKNIIKSLIDCAKSKGLSNDPEVKVLEYILKAYTDGDLKNKTNFNNGGTLNFADSGRWTTIGASAAGGAAAGAAATAWLGPGAALGAWVGGIGGAIAGAFDRPTHNEKIDELMKSIHSKLKAKESN